jgi:hypothetical protein
MRKMVIKGEDGTTIHGRWRAHDGMVTLRSSWGQEITTLIGGSTPRGLAPRGLARLMLSEMEKDRRGHLPTPEERERNIKRAIAEKRFNRMADYADRGRRFVDLPHVELLKFWTAAYDGWTDGDLAQWALVTDLSAEFEIRGVEPPYDEYWRRRRVEDRQTQQAAMRDLQLSIDGKSLSPFLLGR